MLKSVLFAKKFLFCINLKLIVLIDIFKMSVVKG